MAEFQPEIKQKTPIEKDPNSINVSFRLTVPTFTTLTPSSSLAGTGTLARDDLNVGLKGGKLFEGMSVGDVAPLIDGGGGCGPTGEDLVQDMAWCDFVPFYWTRRLLRKLSNRETQIWMC
eukprot:14737131-Ditylum_brightwellii.AAC.1